MVYAFTRKGIRISAFGPDPDGEGTILRLWEQAGTTGICTVTLPPGIQAKKIQPVDLRGTKPDAQIDVKNGKFSFHMKGYAPSSFIIMAF